MNALGRLATSLGKALLTTLIVFLIAAGALVLLTKDAAMLHPSVLSEVQRAISADVSSAGSIEEASPETGAETQLEARRQSAATLAMAWLVATTVVGLLAAWVWLVVAEFISQGVTSVEGQRSAAAPWWGLLICFAVATVASYFGLDAGSLTMKVSTLTFQVCAVVVGLSGVLAYYLGTAVGVKRLMRPSVPLATAWLR